MMSTEAISRRLANRMGGIVRRVPLSHALVIEGAGIGLNVNLPDGSFLSGLGPMAPPERLEIGVGNYEPIEGLRLLQRIRDELRREGVQSEYRVDRHALMSPSGIIDGLVEVLKPFGATLVEETREKLCVVKGTADIYTVLALVFGSASASLVKDYYDSGMRPLSHDIVKHTPPPRDEAHTLDSLNKQTKQSQRRKEQMSEEDLTERSNRNLLDQKGAVVGPNPGQEVQRDSPRKKRKVEAPDNSRKADEERVTTASPMRVSISRALRVAIGTLPGVQVAQRITVSMDVCPKAVDAPGKDLYKNEAYCRMGNEYCPHFQMFMPENGPAADTYRGECPGAVLCKARRRQEIQSQ